MSEKNKYGVYEVFAKFRLEGCRNRLKEKFPEFIYPLSKLQFVERTEDNCCPLTGKTKLSTDGLHIFYTPEHVIKGRLFEVEAQIMHIVLHGILGHFLHQQEYSRHDYRDPLMDAQVGHLMLALGLDNQNLQYNMSQAKQKLFGDLSLKQYYHAIRNPKFGTNLYHIRWSIAVDDHREWNYQELLQQAADQISNELQNHQELLQKFWTEAQNYFIEGSQNTIEFTSITKQILHQVSKRMNSHYGTTAGTETDLVQVKKKTVQSYRELLQELAMIREITKEQPDSIDLMFYHYGLELYENVPLIEPLEYGETRTPELIVIAVDVSGSCCDQKTMEQFWSETYGCISQLRDTFSGGEILILQCDTEIQKENVIQLSQFHEPPNNIQIHGRGGTSFVPVFKKIDTLLRDGKKIDALLYLTDGAGEYPKTPAEVPTYFIMKPEDIKKNKLHNYSPDWITLIELEEPT